MASFWDYAVGWPAYSLTKTVSDIMPNVGFGNWLNSEPETQVGADARFLLKGLTPHAYLPSAKAVQADIGDYFTKPLPKKEAGQTKDDIRAKGREVMQPRVGADIGRTARDLYDERNEGKSFTTEPARSYADMLPAPPAAVAPNLRGIAPPQASTDFSEARRWIEQAQPKPESIDPSVMMLSILGQAAVGAQGKTLAQVLRGAGAGAAGGAMQGEAYERDTVRRNEAARTGYARERGGFEMDVGRVEGQEDFRNRQSVYGHEMDIGKIAADLANKNAERDYIHRTKQAEMNIEAERANAPRVSIHGGQAVQTTRGPNGELVYTMKPLADPNAALTRAMLLGGLGLGGGGAAGLGGGAGGSGRQSPAASIAKNVSDATAINAGVRGGEAMGNARDLAIGAAMNLERIEAIAASDPRVRDMHTRVLAANPAIKTLGAMAKAGSPEAIAMYKGAVAEAYQNAMAGDPSLALIINAIVRGPNG